MYCKPSGPYRSRTDTPFGNWILNPARLPIPPRGQHQVRDYITRLGPRLQLACRYQCLRSFCMLVSVSVLRSTFCNPVLGESCKPLRGRPASAGWGFDDAHHVKKTSAKAKGPRNDLHVSPSPIRFVTNATNYRRSEAKCDFHIAA